MKNVRNIFGHLVHYWEQEDNQKVKTLAGPVTDTQIQSLQKLISTPLPREYVELLKLHNGCKEDSSEYNRFEVGSFYHSEWQFLSVSGVIKTHSHLTSMAKENNQAGGKNEKAESGIRPVFWDIKWLPIFNDTAGNAICLDFNPTNEGSKAQLIYVEYGHDRGKHKIIAVNFLDGFAKIASGLVGNVDGEVPPKPKQEEKKPKWWQRSPDKKPSLEAIQYHPTVDFEKPMPLRELWKYYEAMVRQEYPQSLKYLNSPVTTQQLDALKEILPAGAHLPEDYLQLLRMHNGSRPNADGDIFDFVGYEFLSTEGIVKAHSYLRERTEYYDKHFTRNSNDKPQKVGKGIQPVYNDPAWIPVFASYDWKEFYCIDFNPASGGRKGQVIEVHYRGGPWEVTYPTFTAAMQKMLANELDDFLNWQDDGKEEKVKQPETKKPGWLGWIKPKPAQEELVHESFFSSKPKEDPFAAYLKLPIPQLCDKWADAVRKHGGQFSERTLPPGATSEQIAAVEKEFGQRLPTELIDILKKHNGTGAPMNLWGMHILSTDEIIQDVKRQRAVEFRDSDSHVVPEEGIKKLWWNKKWLPILGNASGDFICVDYDPDAGGTRGQLIEHSHDDVHKNLVGKSFQEGFAKLVAKTIERLEKKAKK